MRIKHLGFSVIVVFLVLTSGIIGQAKGDKTFKGVTVLSNPAAEIESHKIPAYWNNRERKVVYLTFDDGPSRRTEELLEVLARYDIPATFFFVGTQIEGKEDIVEAVYEAGHYVGMHSQSHDLSQIYDESQPDNLSNELITMQDMLENITGHRPVLFRPPYGSMPHMKKESIIQSLVSNGFKAWDWTVDTFDWKASSANEIINTVQLTAGNRNEVVLMHEKALTVEALPKIIEYYLEQGYEFRAYDEGNHMMANFMKDDRL